MSCSYAFQAAEGEQVQEDLVFTEISHWYLAQGAYGKEVNQFPEYEHYVDKKGFADVFWQVQGPGKKQGSVYHEKHGDS
ncbi:hypothetical protein F240042I4_39090 [Eisenbergiella tayi]